VCFYVACESFSSKYVEFYGISKVSERFGSGSGGRNLVKILKIQRWWISASPDRCEIASKVCGMCLRVKYRR